MTTDGRRDRAGAGETIRALAKAHVAARCLHVVAELGVADALDDRPATAAELAARTGLDADALGRMLRLLAAEGVFAEGPDGYEHSPASELLRQDHPRSVRAYARLHGLPGMWDGFTQLVHAARTGRPAGGWADLVARLALHERESRVFNEAMADKSVTVIPALVDAYDFDRAERIADIGGGHGHLLRAILGHVPAAAGLVFELPHVVAEAAPASPKLRFVAGDFFVDPLPPADLYLLMDVLHDWRDDDAARILEAVRTAAPDHARVLIVETLVAQAPGRHFSKTLDVIMLAVTGGRERSPAEYAALLQGAGLHLQRVIETRSQYSMVEAVVAKADRPD